MAHRLSRAVWAVAAGTVFGGVGLTVWNAQDEALYERRQRAAMMTGGNPELAEAHMRRYGCAGCHQIPGVAGPKTFVGPPLDDVGRRVYIAGVMINTPTNMVDWIVDPPAVDPLTAMPVTGINEAEARDVAAYLYSLQ